MSRVFSQIRQSVWRTIKDGFVDGTLTGTVYNVYGETELRAGVVPVRPFVYVLDFGVTFEMQHLPVVIVHVVSHRKAFEMGTKQSYFNEVALHVFGRNRGERDDLSSAIVENIDSIALLDFDAVGTPVVQTVELAEERGITWTIVPGNIVLSDDLQWGGSLSNWDTAICSFWVPNANIWT
jgi:hypothetical protein